MSDYITLYDSTLRDGAQMRGVDFTVADKLAIAQELDKLGIDYIEGGWPGANPVDDAFFAQKPVLAHASITAFGMTRRPGRSTENDPGLADLINAGTGSICIVGKSWDFHVTEALGISFDENRKMIRESVQHLRGKKKELLFDAEHFFDGYKANPEFALACAREAYDAGARWIVLCDTNGGTLPHEIGEIIGEVSKHIPGENLGIHCHNDTEQAVANSLAAVEAGARQIQGTINGVGERCGNANLMSIIPTLVLKMGFRTGISDEHLTLLTPVAHMLDERLNRASNPHQPYVGSAAFAHKGGLHVSAMAKNTASYEHIPPESVGNQRSYIISDKAGRSNVLTRLKEVGLETDNMDAVDSLVRKLKEMERKGYAFEGADASFYLLARKVLQPDSVPEYFELTSFRVLDERRYNARQQIITLSEATIKLLIGEEAVMTVAEGNGPVNALDEALRKSMRGTYPSLADMRLTDYKVRIMTPEQGTRAVTRVIIESSDSKGNQWATVGVSANVIDASYNALRDSITYKLLRAGEKAAG